MKLWLAIGLSLFFTLFSPVKTKAAGWYYPLQNTLKRQSLKTFGEYIDANFYKTAPEVFPAKFTGYHAGTDWEIFSDELNKEVPVYTVSAGKIIYSGTVSGYGGLILEQLDGINKTALYGHLKPSSLILSGKSVKAGEKIAVLGNAYSDETAGERKHLHFGIYNGNDLYFKGYEDNLYSINSKWVNPLLFLKDNNSLDPSKTSSTDAIKIKISPGVKSDMPSRNEGIVFRLGYFVKSLLAGLIDRR